MTCLTHSYPNPGGGFRNSTRATEQRSALPSLSQFSGQQLPQAGAPQGTAHSLNPCAHSLPQLPATMQSHSARDRCQDPSSCARAAALKERGRYKTRRKKFLIQVEVPPSFTLEKRNFWEVIFQEPVYLSARLIAGNSCSVNHLQKDHRSGRGWCCHLLQRNST